MTNLILLLEIYAPQGRQSLYKTFPNSDVPRIGEHFLIENGLRCLVEDVTWKISGGAEIRLRFKEGIGDLPKLLTYLQNLGWQLIEEQASSTPPPLRPKSI